MGQSTDAYLFFGFDMGEDWEPPWGNEDDPNTPDDWEEAYAAKKGVKKPIFPRDNWDDKTRATYEAWYSEMKKATEGVGVDIGSHCSSEYPMHYMYTRRFCAWRGSPVIVNPGELETTEDDVRRLREFCEFLNIDVDGKEPAWFLASMWS